MCFDVAQFNCAILYLELRFTSPRQSPQGGLYPPPLLFLHAANGETERTVVSVIFGTYAGVVEEQKRASDIRCRERRTAPGITAHAHTGQVAGIAVAATRSGVDGYSRPAKK